MICKVCGSKMILTKWGLYLCSECEFKSNDIDDPQELNFDEEDI